jgi:hypothetical protein
MVGRACTRSRQPRRHGMRRYGSSERVLGWAGIAACHRPAMSGAGGGVAALKGVEHLAQDLGEPVKMRLHSSGRRDRVVGGDRIHDGAMLLR